MITSELAYGLTRSISDPGGLIGESVEADATKAGLIDGLSDGADVTGESVIEDIRLASSINLCIFSAFSLVAGADLNFPGDKLLRLLCCTECWAVRDMLSSVADLTGDREFESFFNSVLR